jgi:hypothetical protein
MRSSRSTGRGATKGPSEEALAAVNEWLTDATLGRNDRRAVYNAESETMRPPPPTESRGRPREAGLSLSSAPLNPRQSGVGCDAPEHRPANEIGYYVRYLRGLVIVFGNHAAFDYALRWALPSASGGLLMKRGRLKVEDCSGGGE